MENRIDKNSGVVAENIENVNIVMNPELINVSILAKFISNFATYFSSVPIDNNSYTIENKIEHNNIVTYKTIIDKYYSFAIQCEETLDAIDNAKPNSKLYLLNKINDLYLKIKGEKIKIYSEQAMPEIDIIRKSSDEILGQIIDCLQLEANKMEELSSQDFEVIQINITALVVYCFVECKILEKPVEGDL